jgi:hypothetical protein
MPKIMLAIGSQLSSGDRDIFDLLSQIKKKPYNQIHASNPN